MQIKTHIAIVISITILGYFSFAIAQEKTNQTTDLNSVLKLGEMGDKRAVKPLIAVIKDKSKNSYTRKHAASVLAKLGSLAIEPLIDTLNINDP
ncbi:TPA: HEAT repeat domain-containing protein, partial [Candidatus Poribacteria bacterium]|nr:HEAT repeat domain-containing protein [Candidatus Poribacteria bacterium]